MIKTEDVLRKYLTKSEFTRFFEIMRANDGMLAVVRYRSFFVESLEEAMLDAFSWQRTEEGHEYWEAISMRTKPPKEN